jgi:hypothetical protein
LKLPPGELEAQTDRPPSLFGKHPGAPAPPAMAFGATVCSMRMTPSAHDQITAVETG